MFEDMFAGGIPGVLGSEICLELGKLALLAFLFSSGSSPGGGIPGVFGGALCMALLLGIAGVFGGLSAVGRDLSNTLSLLFGGGIPGVFGGALPMALLPGMAGVLGG